MRINIHAQETSTRRIVFLLFGLSILVGAIMGGILFFRLAYLWGIVFLLSWFWYSSASRGLELRRTIKTSRAQVGQIFEQQYDVQNSSLFPLFWLEMHDECPLPGSQNAYVLNYVRGKKSRSFLLRTRLDKRGVYQMGPVSVSFGDIFGLFHGNRTITERVTLVVYPILFDIGYFPVPAGLLSGGEASRRRTHQITPNAAGVREYAPGDPLNRIHWLSTIRRNQLMVKEFELDPSADVWIFLDSEAEVHSELPITNQDETVQDFWDWLPFTELPAHSIPFVTNELHGNVSTIHLPPSTEEYATSIGVSLANYFLRQGKAVGVASVASTLTLLPPDRSSRQLGKILEALAFIRADGDIPLSGWAETQARHLTRGSIIILITPSIQTNITFLADHLNNLGLRPIVILLNAASFGGSAGSDQIYSDIQVLGFPVFLIDNGDDLNAIFTAKITMSSLKASETSIRM